MGGGKKQGEKGLLFYTSSPVVPNCSVKWGLEEKQRFLFRSFSRFHSLSCINKHTFKKGVHCCVTPLLQKSSKGYKWRVSYRIPEEQGVRKRREKDRLDRGWARSSSRRSAEAMARNKWERCSATGKEHLFLEAPQPTHRGRVASSRNTKPVFGGFVGMETRTWRAFTPFEKWQMQPPDQPSACLKAPYFCLYWWPIDRPWRLLWEANG